MARKSRQPQHQAILLASSSNENTVTVYQTGIYARLSNKNFMSTDVDVLGNQLNHLRDYVANHDDMVLVDTYIDDGWCGSSFNRPDFNRMMADVKSGRINCVVVRDFSRFGRNYLEMGYYLNEVFPSYNLRFISIFDDFDSLVSDADSMLFSMMQIVNDFYSKDISRKICAVYDAKVSKGFCWGSIPYGYFRRKDGTGRLLMDESTAPINSHDIPTISEYNHSRAKAFKSGVPVPELPYWDSTKVVPLLRNPVYKGTVVLSVKLDTVTKEIAVAEKRRDEVDLYFSIDNKWLRTFVETGAQNEMTSELIHQLIQRIDVYSDKRVQITFNYANWMNPLLECVEALKQREIQPV